MANHLVVALCHNVTDTSCPCQEEVNAFAVVMQGEEWAFLH